jgi:hypothetical protein
MIQINISDSLIGRFYFKKTSNGNIKGEFSNNKSDFIYSESADLQSEFNSDTFIGTYNATWQEEGESFFAVLNISHKKSSLQRIYELEWVTKEGKLMFIGEGFVFENTLIGDYRNFNITKI